MRRILYHLYGFTLGTLPGVAYAYLGMVEFGDGAFLFLVVVGGAAGLGLTWPSVSGRRVAGMLSQTTPLLLPLALIPQEEDETPSAPLPPPPRIVPPADSRWLTPNVLALAHTIRETDAEDLLPILADALEDAGCTESEILRQCRARECPEQILERLLGPYF